jgi:hypothetical protein
MATPAYRFCSFELDTCVEVARAVQDGGGQLTTAELATRLGYKSHDNGSFNTRLANSRLFGLISGPAGAIRCTDRALDILHPDYPATEDQARLEAFEGVPLYSVVLAEYNGKPLPDEAGLKNALVGRWGISADKATAVLARMLDSAEQAGLFRTAGNRSRIVRPTINGGQSRPSNVAGPQPSVREVPGPITAPRVDGARTNKLIDGALDMLPAENWSEEELAQWIAFFESALRVVYRLPRAG